MSIGRRTFLRSVGLAAMAAPFCREALAASPGAPRAFELVTNVELAATSGAARAWVPIPAKDFGEWLKVEAISFTGEAAEASLKRDQASGAMYVEAAWPDGAPARLEVVCRVSTRDRAVDLDRTDAPPLNAAERAAYLRPTRLVPLDGIVKATSEIAVRGARSDLAKAHAIYEWVVEHTHRDPAVAGCGSGDVVAMLESMNAGSMGGKCADINRLYVGLARAAGLPARDLYGVRLAPSRLGYNSLGANSQTVTKAQHCRAEVHIDGVGWIPVDPADVRKVALEEPPGRPDMGAPRVAAARKALFGAWEGNWLAYNDVQDVRLSGSRGDALPFLMYPQAEVGGERLNCLDAENVCYSITSRELVA